MSLPNELLPVGLLGSTSAGGALSTYSIERSVRFNPSDSAYLTRTPTVAGNRKTWTWAGWVKRSTVTNTDLDCFFACVPSASDYVQLAFQPGTNYLGLYIANPSNTAQSFSLNVYRDLSAWYHIVVAFDSTQATITNRLKVYVNGIEIAYSTDARTYITQNTDFAVNSVYQHTISGIVPYSSARYFSGYLADVYFIDGQALSPTSFGEFSATTGVWMPKAYSGGSYGTNGFHLDFSNNASAAALGTDTSGNGNNWTPNNLSVNPFYFSVSPIPGAPQDAFNGVTSNYAYAGSTTVFTLNPAVAVTGGRIDMIGRVGPGYTYKAITNAGTFTLSEIGTWPGLGGTYGQQYSVTNESITSLLGIQVETTAANWTLAGVQTTGNPSVVGNQLLVIPFAVPSTDSFIDVPVNGTQTDTGLGGEIRGNYCVFSPLAVSGQGQATLGNGNLEISGTGVSVYQGCVGTIALAEGKYYWEYTITAAGSVNGAGIVATSSLQGAIGSGYGYAQVSDAWYRTSGAVYSNAALLVSGLSALTTGDIINVAVDFNAGKLWFGRNGTWDVSGNPSTGTNPTVTFTPGGKSFYPMAQGYGAWSGVLNSGQRSFNSPAPSGFKTLCSTNLSTPITKPSTAIDIALYTGTGSTLTPTNSLEFSPDVVWIKSRSGATDHAFYDKVRGAQLDLVTNSWAAETTQSTGLTAFNSNGFTVGALAKLNTNAATYAAWCWSAGSTTVTNTQGSITSTVRANPTAGFSIVSYTQTNVNNATIGHGLNAAPVMIIYKNRDISQHWYVMHQYMRSSSVWDNYFLLLSDPSPLLGIYGTFNNVAPTSTLLNLSNLANGPNAGTAKAMLYCFTPIIGYSSFNSYTGNGNVDGPVVYLGFRPALIIIKGAAMSSNWLILDSKRDGYNVDNDSLFTNSANVEDTTDLIDITSNGFKIRTTNTAINNASSTYIYAAWAENPFSLARAR